MVAMSGLGCAIAMVCGVGAADACGTGFIVGLSMTEGGSFRLVVLPMGTFSSFYVGYDGSFY